VKRDSGALNGTGPFHIVNWQPGIRLELAADENCWRGRPFLDGVEIQMGRSFHDQMTALQFGKADLTELAPEQIHHISQDGRRLVSSAPLELLALVFARDAASSDEKTLRETLGWSIERGSIRDVLLQGAGQPDGSLLPTWISGYGFVFPSGADLTKARQLRNQVHAVPTWKLGYDSGNSLDRLLAERIALNAKDAGLSLQPTSAGSADLRLMRIPLATSAPWLALENIGAQTGLTIAPGAARSTEDLYAAEQAAVAARRVIPLFHLPVSYISSSSLKSWSVRPDGSWDVDNAWLEAPQP
jgi:ABC-type transport system substrate-binding protein